ncbi:MAG TPA: 6-bladed beta-propeller, partial [Acidobacteriota bacterium]
MLGVLALAAIAAAGCNLGDDFAESLVEKTAKRNEERRIEQQREALPLPDPSVVPFVRVANEDLDVNEDFHVDLVDDLVIGAGRTEPEYLFVSFGGSSFGLGNVAVDEMGRIYVLDTRNSEVRVFDRDGGYLFAFGRPGEGPGDFQRPFAVVIAGGEL